MICKYPNLGVSNGNVDLPLFPLAVDPLHITTQMIVFF